MTSHKIFCCHSNALGNVSGCEGLPTCTSITLRRWIIGEALAYLRDQETPVKPCWMEFGCLCIDRN